MQRAKKNHQVLQKQQKSNKLHLQTKRSFNLKAHLWLLRIRDRRNSQYQYKEISNNQPLMFLYRLKKNLPLKSYLWSGV